VTTGLWIITAIVALLVAAIAIEAYVKRNKRRILSQTQPTPPQANPERVELGQEETNLKMVDRDGTENQPLENTNRRSIRRNMK